MKEDESRIGAPDLKSERPLQSWKEIAAFLERDERTARRWETEEGLPIRRHRDNRRSSVYAYPSEIDKWRMAKEPKTAEMPPRTSLLRRSLLFALGPVVVLAVVWLVTYSPIFNPPNPFVEAADGIILRQVLAEPGISIDGLAPSPDGRYLALVDWQNSQGDLALRELETGKTQQLTSDGGDSAWLGVVRQAVFSPDGSRVAYCWYTEEESYELRVVTVDGSGQQTLYRTGVGVALGVSDWSSDGHHLLVLLLQQTDADSQQQGAPHHTCQIGIVSLQDGSLRTLKSLDWRPPMKMCFSPDGRFVTYDAPSGKHPSNHDLYLLAVDTLHVTPLLEHPANDFLLGWAPDGRSLLFTSDRMGHWGMWMLPLNESGQPDGPAKLIKRDTGLIQPLGFTRDGSFFYGIRSGGSNVYSAKLDLETLAVVEGPNVVIQRFMGSNRSPSWSPDGKYLAYVSMRNTLPKMTVLCIRSEETGKERELSPELTRFSGLRWSLDGHSILTRGFDMNGYRGIFEIDVQTGNVSTVLIESDIGPTFPEWAPEGRAIYYVRNEWAKKLSQIMLRDLETGDEKEIARADEGTNYTGFGVAPDGDRIALRIWRDDIQSSELVVWSLNDGRVDRLVLTKEPEWVSAFAWTLDSKRLILFRSIESDPKLSELWSMSASGEDARRLGLQATGVLGFDGLPVHPGGQSILYAARGGDAESKIWVMEGLLESRETSSSETITDANLETIAEGTTDH